MKLEICYYDDARSGRYTETVMAGEGTTQFNRIRNNPRRVIISMTADDDAVVYIVSRLANIPYAKKLHFSTPVETKWRGENLAFILDNIDFGKF